MSNNKINLKLFKFLEMYLSRDFACSNFVREDSFLYGATVEIIDEKNCLIITKPIRDTTVSIVLGLIKVGSQWCIDAISNRDEIKEQNLYLNLQDLNDISDMLAFLTSKSLQLEML